MGVVIAARSTVLEEVASIVGCAVAILTSVYIVSHGGLGGKRGMMSDFASPRGWEIRPRVWAFVVRSKVWEVY